MSKRARVWDGVVEEFLGSQPIAQGDVVRKRAKIDSGKTYIFGTLLEGDKEDQWVLQWENEEEEAVSKNRASSLRIKGQADAPTKAYLKRIREPLKEENAADDAPPPPPPAAEAPEASPPPPPEEEEAAPPLPPAAEEQVADESAEPLAEEEEEQPTEDEPEKQRLASTKAARYYSALARVAAAKPPRQVGALEPAAEPAPEQPSAPELPDSVLRIDDVEDARSKLRSAK